MTSCSFYNHTYNVYKSTHIKDAVSIICEIDIMRVWFCIRADWLQQWYKQITRLQWHNSWTTSERNTILLPLLTTTTPITDTNTTASSTSTTHTNTTTTRSCGEGSCRPNKSTKYNNKWLKQFDIRPHCHHFIWPTRGQKPNSTSISSAIFAQLTADCLWACHAQARSFH